jgi:chromosome condensin MukBEF ATPase and DNA-binding subunit MukB
MTSHGEERASVNPPSSPSREELRNSLRALHEELARTARIDADSHHLLQQLLRDMQRLLHDPEVPGDTGAPERPTRRLEALAVQFEANHPRLAGSLRQFVELCSRAGL